MGDLIYKAMKFAEKKHEGQERKMKTEELGWEIRYHQCMVAKTTEIRDLRETLERTRNELDKAYAESSDKTLDLMNLQLEYMTAQARNKELENTIDYLREQVEKLGKLAKDRKITIEIQKAALDKHQHIHDQLKKYGVTIYPFDKIYVYPIF